MNNIIKRKWNQNSMVIIEDLQGMAFQAESGGHTFQISGIDGEGNTVALSGTPAGVMLRSDGQDVTLTCSVSGGVVFATLPANAYSVPGRFGLTIFLTSDGQKTAIYAAVGTVGKTSSGTVAPPAGSDVVDLVNAIAAAVATIPASYTDLMAAVAPTYSSSGLYAVGSYAWYNGKLYRCTTAITSGETWTSGHWTLANLGSDLVDLKSALSAVSILENGLALLSGITQNESSVVKNIQYIEVKGNTSLVGWRLGIAVASSKNISFFDSSNNQITASYSSGRKINVVELADGTTVNVKYNWDNHTNDIANYYAQSHIEVANQSNLQINGFEALRVAKKAENILVDSKIENSAIIWEANKCVSSTGALVATSGYYASNALAVIPNSRCKRFSRWSCSRGKVRFL